MTKQTICLNMIVKDEAHVVLGTLQKLTSKIPLDYWVICDTGSTDGTQKIIQDFFAELGIPGELYEDVWKDFGHNRTLAVQRAKGKGDYILFFDADDDINGDITVPHFNADSYNFQFIGGGVTYQRCLLVKGSLDWQWYGVLHEYVGAPKDDKKPRTQSMLEGNYHIISGRTGSRSKDPQKYYKDALVLEKAYETEEDPGMKGRYAYYCGQSYKDSNMLKEAAEWYKTCAEISNWDEEAFSADYLAADCMRKANNTRLDVLQAQYFRAWMRRPWRIEPIFDLGCVYRDMKLWKQAYALFKICALQDKPNPDVDKLFISWWMYEGAAMDEFSISAYWSGEFEESVVACNNLIQSGKYSGPSLGRIQKNLWFAERQLGKFDEEALDKFIEEKKNLAEKQFA